MEQPFAHNPLRRIAWKALMPVRAYVNHSPFSRGKGFILRRVIAPILPGGDRSFIYSTSSGDKLLLRYRETLGREALMGQGFEEVERAVVGALALPGTTAIDVGANIGVFTVSLARSVGRSGRVIAVEPVPNSADQIRQNLALNNLGNTTIIKCAASDTEGQIDVVQTTDSAYNTTTHIAHPGLKPESTIRVDTMTLDRIWMDAGRPKVSVIKVDVEGAEMSVLNGSVTLLETNRPHLMMEANTTEELQVIEGFLSAFGYSCSQPEGFMPWNYLFRSSEARQSPSGMP